ncbi:MAG: thioredoxin family protein [Candidatus Babeliales bacterium]|nr:thioredoxin family protein [Candidatus Babeliales bacterium]
MKFNFLVLITLLSLSGCVFFKKSENISQNSNKSTVINLEDSTKIILSLIKSNNLEETLDLKTINDKSSVSLLIENFSPAQLALEAEVLNWPKPVIMVFFRHDDQWFNMKKILENYAKNDNDLKYVEVNSENLFKIAEEFAIEANPTILLIQNRSEINRVENIQSINQFDQELKKIIHEINLSK